MKQLIQDWYNDSRKIPEAWSPRFSPGVRASGTARFTPKLMAGDSAGLAQGWRFWDGQMSEVTNNQQGALTATAGSRCRNI